jgi:hypothetical protein
MYVSICCYVEIYLVSEWLVTYVQWLDVQLRYERRPTQATLVSIISAEHLAQLDPVDGIDMEYELSRRERMDLSASPPTALRSPSG